jgi:hypothetical protein
VDSDRHEVAGVVSVALENYRHFIAQLEGLVARSYVLRRKTLARIEKLLSAGMSATRIAETLTAEGHLHPHGLQWTAERLKGVTDDAGLDAFPTDEPYLVFPADHVDHRSSKAAFGRSAKVASASSDSFNDEVAQAFSERGLLVRKNAVKFGHVRLADRKGNSLGDVDVLCCEVHCRRLIAVECKDFEMASLTR